MFTAMAKARPAITIFAIFLYGCRPTPAAATSATTAKPAAISVSHSK